MALQMPRAVLKIGPTVYFRKRAFARSSLLLTHFSLCKPMTVLALKFDQTFKYLTPLFDLFDIQTDRKPFPVEALTIDLRQMKEAGQFLNQQQLDDIIKYYGGNIPKALNLNTLFQPAVIPVIMDGSMNDATSVTKSSMSASKILQESTGELQLTQLIHRATINHRPVDTFDLTPIPDSII